MAPPYLQKQVEDRLQAVFLRAATSGEKLNVGLHGRAQKICEQIRHPIASYFADRELRQISVLDLGCGDGGVSLELERAAANANLPMKFTLADTHKYLRPEVEKSKGTFDFNLLDESYKSLRSIPGGPFDCILILTVLHHANDPVGVFKAAAEQLREGGLIVVIESCVGVSLNFINNHPSVLGGNILDTPQRQAAEGYANLTPDNQVRYGCFMDWFYNRILHDGVKVPCEFGSPEKWNQQVFQRSGMRIISTFCEGFDQVTVPEFHTLHVISRSRS